MKALFNSTNHPPISLRFYSIFCALILALLSSCSFEEPVLPQWAVTVNVPFAEETFKLGEEIINDSTIVAQGADSLIYINFDGDLDTTEVSAVDFTLGAIDTTQYFAVGQLDIGSLEVIESDPVTLGQIYPELRALAQDGLEIPVTIPEVTLTPDPTVIESDDFIGIHVVSGSMRVVFINNLPFSLGPNAATPNGMQFTITDSTGQEVLSVSVPTTVAPGDTVDETSPLTTPDGWIYAPLTVSYTLPVPQTTTFGLRSGMLDSTGVELSSTLDDVVADEAIARIDPQEFSDTLSFAIETEHQLREVVMDAGVIDLDFTNETGLETDVEVNIPNLLDAQGNSFVDNLHLEPGDQQQLVLDLSDMRIAEPTGKYVDSLSVFYTATTEAPQGYLHVRSSDRVVVDISVRNINLRSFAGFMSPDTFDIDPIEEKDLVDYSDFPEGISLNNASLQLVLNNEIYIENLALDLFVVGYHREESGGITDSAVVAITDRRINPGRPGAPGTTVITIDGADIANLLNILPTDIRTSGNVRGSGDVEINQNAAISGSYSFATPLMFEISQEAIWEGDEEILFDEDIDDDLQEATEENFENAELAVQLTNHTPLGASFRLIVSADPARISIYDEAPINPELEFEKTITITEATIDPVTGFVTEAAQNELLLQLTKEQAMLFQNPPLRIGYQLRIPETNGTVAVRASDFLKIAGMARVEINVKD
ncbi:MAG: hypothetical protein ACRBF0_12650 [Calditrichia bacterium]